jgi:Glucodextranase, domain B
MDSRSGGRPPQVRPRPASTGRAHVVKTRPVQPSPTRLARYRRVERRRALPLPIKATLAASVVLLSMGILWVASSAVGPMVNAALTGLGEVVSSIGNVVSSPEPTEPPAIATAPSIVAPDEPYTNDDVIDVTVNVPAAWVGKDGYTVRLWVTLPDKEPELLDEVAVGPTSVLVIPEVELQKGRNDFQASVNGPGGEGELSGVATWVLDQSRPRITITSPKASSSTTRDSVTIKGKTQARSTVRVRNELTSAVVTVLAGKDGLFQAKIGVSNGINEITITATDPAGNPNTESVRVRKGSGDMTVSLTGSAYRFTAKRLPRTVTFTVVVSGPDGRRLPGAVALFTVSVPGLEAIVSDEKLTNGSGVASFTTSIPKGALPGSGLASVLVSSDSYGQKTDRQVLTVR